MIRFSLRTLPAGILLAAVALVLACSEPVQPPSAAKMADQARLIRGQLDDLHQRAARIDERIEQLREVQARQSAALTSESQSLIAEIAVLDRQLGGKPVPADLLKSVPSGKGAAPAEREPGPLSPLSRLLLIVITLFAIWMIARIFLGRLNQDEEDEDDFANEGADEELTTEDGTIRISPEAHAPAAEPVESPRSETEGETPETKP